MNDLTITFDPFIKMEGDLFLKDQILNISDRASRILGKYDPQIVFGVMFMTNSALNEFYEQENDDTKRNILDLISYMNENGKCGLDAFNIKNLLDKEKILIEQSPGEASILDFCFKPENKMFVKPEDNPNWITEISPHDTLEHISWKETLKTGFTNTEYFAAQALANSTRATLYNLCLIHSMPLDEFKGAINDKKTYKHLGWYFERDEITDIFADFYYYTNQIAVCVAEGIECITYAEIHAKNEMEADEKVADEISKRARNAAHIRHAKTYLLKDKAIDLFNSKEFQSVRQASKYVFTELNTFAQENKLSPLSQDSGQETVYRWLRKSKKEDKE